ncbi:MAG TPA: hypothetical protein VKP65_12025 [Rhodothermales bacterium]|nr:hypothetical protein [Rhodothermales bacterium]
MGEDATTVRIARGTLFIHTLGQPLGYSAKSSASDIAAAEISGSDTLRVEILPLQAGEAQIDLKATDRCGQSQTVTFKVEVADICTLVADQTYAAYFPIQVGHAWTYSYQSDTQGMNYPHYQTTSTLQWELIAATACAHGSQTFTIQETFDGVTTLPSDNPDYREEQSWTRTLSGQIKGRALHLGRYTEALPVQWSYPVSTPDTVETQTSAGSNYPYYSERSSIVLKRETGITRWYTGYSAVHNEYSNTRITLNQ